MTESEFHQRVDATLAAIEDAIDGCGADIDYDTSGGILTLSFGNGSRIILNRQTPVQQLWVAARSGGFHCDYDAGSQAWRCEAGELFELLSRLCGEQAGIPIQLSPA
jgi:CyaY protein